MDIFIGRKKQQKKEKHTITPTMQHLRKELIPMYYSKKKKITRKSDLRSWRRSRKKFTEL
jgi:hypothetical protein